MALQPTKPVPRAPVAPAKPAGPAPVAARRPVAPAPAAAAAPARAPLRPTAAPVKPAPAPVKPTAPAPVRAAPAPVARPAAPTPKPAVAPQAPPAKRGGPTPAPRPASSAVATAQQAVPANNREAGGKGQMKIWLLDFLANDGDVQAAIQALGGTSEEEPAAEEEVDHLADFRDKNGDLDANGLYNATATMTQEQLDALPAELGETFEYPANAVGLIPRRKFVKTWLEQNAQAEEEGEAAEEDGEESPWCDNKTTGQWYYKTPIEELEPGHVVCFTKDLAAEGEEAGSAGYAWITGNIADPPLAEDERGDLMLRMDVKCDKDNRAVLQTLDPDGKPLKIGENVQITFYPNVPLEEQQFEYVGIPTDPPQME